MPRKRPNVDNKKGIKAPKSPGILAQRDAELVRKLCRWFAGAARDLPWRAVDANTGRRDPYRSLVSEFMLQQTQVSRVLEKFDPFLSRFPDVRSLAQAEIGNVLEAWSGLGYYRRARNLHHAAKAVVGDFGGDVPRDLDELEQLAGVGRYTAGAIASMVYGKQAALVDGNVARVLLRVEGKQLAQVEGMKWAWGRATELIEHTGGNYGPGAFNEGLMELGATVCTPAAPKCDQCPLENLCEAKRLGIQSKIPRPKLRAERSQVVHSSVLVKDPAGRVLVEKRGETGLWAGMWQAPTLETKAAPTPRRLAAWIGVKSVQRVGGFVHHTTHRVVEFVIWDAGVAEVKAQDRRWVRSVEGLAMGNAQKRVLKMVGVT